MINGIKLSDEVLLLKGQRSSAGRQVSACEC